MSVKIPMTSKKSGVLCFSFHQLIICMHIHRNKLIESLTEIERPKRKRQNLILMETMKTRDDNLHVVMQPWLAFGHIMPFFQLSVALAKAGVHVSLVSTPKNVQRLPKFPADVSGLIDLVVLPLPAIDRDLLPEDAEATVDVPFYKI